MIKLENGMVFTTRELVARWGTEKQKASYKKAGKLSKNVKEIAIPKLNFVISSYYKGTGLEEVLKKLEKYLDTADVNESDITNI